ncbi:multiheme c-type cytochrome [Sulfurimonas sp.]|uniref:multiheme c-type cytochrome n=1 Tax=Sulfurimonas sp. TaxID=2022749 RepID=UPI002632B7C9|nr:multiheme c-type cytochrome [Sulfurimonas sp.]MCW8895517.1 cytochrome c family protein [Sulfurimonas sp.]
MVKKQNMIYSIFKILIFMSLLLSINLSAEVNQRIVDELASPKPEIPLKNAMGEKAYNDAINSGRYRYVGNSKCRLCHRKFFIGRKNDPHDHSMESLVRTGYEKNSHCLTCHSTGHGTETGYVNEEWTPRLSNVQCEGCHGPGNVHIDMAKAKTRKREEFIEGGFLAGQDSPKVLKKMCTSCHTKRWNKSYHDLDKSYDTYKKADPKSSRYK